MLNRGLDKLELLRIVEAVANEKSIDKELVIGSMESAIQKAALTKFGSDNNIEVVIDRETGEIKIQKVLEIVETVEDSAREISLDEAKKSYPKNNNLKVFFLQHCPPKYCLPSTHMPPFPTQAATRILILTVFL